MVLFFCSPAGALKTAGRLYYMNPYGHARGLFFVFPFSVFVFSAFVVVVIFW